MRTTSLIRRRIYLTSIVETFRLKVLAFLVRFADTLGWLHAIDRRLIRSYLKWNEAMVHAQQSKRRYEISNSFESKSARRLLYEFYLSSQIEEDLLLSLRRVMDYYDPNGDDSRCAKVEEQINAHRNSRGELMSAIHLLFAKPDPYETRRKELIQEFLESHPIEANEIKQAEAQMRDLLAEYTHKAADLNSMWSIVTDRAVSEARSHKEHEAI